jgi:hypothetical protein
VKDDGNVIPEAFAKAVSDCYTEESVKTVAKSWALKCATFGNEHAKGT